MKLNEVNAIVDPQYRDLKNELLTLIESYDKITTYIAKGNRNTIKLATLSNGKKIAIKSFKLPNAFNRHIYKFFRKPKGKRSFEHAAKLLELNFNTPHPVAYIEYSTKTAIKQTFYISEYFEYDITYRELLTNLEYPDKQRILEQFTEFSYQLHENGIEFLDHSPGNTLIKKQKDNTYKFYLVDLNRMKFHNHMNFKIRMKNLSHLTTNIQDIEKIASHYAFLIGKSSKDVFTRLWLETIKFQFRFHKKKEIKSRMKKFYRNEL